MGIKVPNNASSLLTQALAVGGTQAKLLQNTGAKFGPLAVGEWFYATLVHPSNLQQIEVVKVVAQAGDTLTVERGQDGTGVYTFPAGSLIEARWNAAQVKELAGSVIEDLTASDIGLVPVGDLTATNVQEAFQALFTSIAAGVQDISAEDPIESSGGVNPTLSLKTQEGVTPGNYFGLVVDSNGLIIETPSAIASPGSSGAIELPSGLILAWGSFAAAAAVVFPTPFPNACFAAVITPSTAVVHGVAAISPAGFNIVGGPLTGTYIAIGN